jgi:hypothetical protein
MLIHSAVAYRGADLEPHFMSDHSLFVTFWTGSAIMVLALLLAIYYARLQMADFSDPGTVRAT